MALRDHVLPSIENEVHRALKDAADEVAIRVFAENVRRLLLEAPFGPKPVLGVDPGLRTGCKLAAVDASGAFSYTTTLPLNGTVEGAHVLHLTASDKAGNGGAPGIRSGISGPPADIRSSRGRRHLSS